MESKKPGFSCVGRGCSWGDKICIALLIAFRSRPGFWRLLTACFGKREWMVTVRTPRGPARLIFNPTETSELTVIDELLPGHVYIVSGPASLFLDCGAFRGISTIYLQDQVKAERVIAFEPQAENFAVLSRRLSEYLPEVTVLNAAVGEKSGEASFGGEGVGGGIGLKGSIVPLVRLRDELKSTHASSLLLKVDIEGAERDLLPDVLDALPERCAMFLETHFAEGQAESLLEPLQKAGFSCREVRRHQGLDPDIWFVDWELKRDQRL